jgi:hypothetical protein
MKVPNEAWKQYGDWKRHIRTHNPRIPKDCRRPTLIAFCLFLAEHGSAGLNCYAGDVTLAKELGIHRKYLAKYRRLAVELGWFEPNGIKGNRVEHLDISIPTLQVDVIELPEVEPAKVPPVKIPKPRKPADKPILDDDDPWVIDRLSRGDSS